MEGGGFFVPIKVPGVAETTSFQDYLCPRSSFDITQDSPCHLTRSTHSLRRGSLITSRKWVNFDVPPTSPGGRARIPSRHTALFAVREHCRISPKSGRHSTPRVAQPWTSNCHRATSMTSTRGVVLMARPGNTESRTRVHPPNGAAGITPVVQDPLHLTRFSASATLPSW